MDLLEKIDLYTSDINEETEYQKFFQKKLKAFGAKSPEDLEGDKKKKFFDEVDKEYKAKKETD